jgi:hypothetical protein
MQIKIAVRYNHIYKQMTKTEKTMWNVSEDVNYLALSYMSGRCVKETIWLFSYKINMIQ